MRRAIYKGYWLLNLWYGGRLVIDKEVPADELQTLLEVATGIHDSMNSVMQQLEEFEDIVRLPRFRWSLSGSHAYCRRRNLASESSSCLIECPRCDLERALRTTRRRVAR